MYEALPPPVEVSASQPQHEIVGLTFAWLSAKVAENEALDDQTLKDGGERARQEWWQQRQKLGEKVLDFTRQNPDKGRDLFEAMVTSESDADKRFIVRLLADYMDIEGQSEDAAENFAALLLGQDTSESAALALTDAVNEGRLTAAEVAHIALATADFARWEMGRPSRSS